MLMFVEYLDFRLNSDAFFGVWMHMYFVIYSIKYVGKARIFLCIRKQPMILNIRSRLLTSQLVQI